MQFNHEINRLLFGVMLLFGIVALAAAYWAVVGPDTILEREDNPRRVQAEAAILRGGIYDRSEQPLVTSAADASGAALRQYHSPAAYSALGYYNLRYGTAGVENAYDAILRGDTLERSAAETIRAGLLHQPQVGTDIRLTFDLELQQQLADALTGQIGAAVLLSVPDGAVLALASLPTYNPNTLTADWDQLRDAPGNPFFNRAVQGLYQPGGALQTVLMAGALAHGGIALDTAIVDAATPLHMSDTTLRCAAELPPVSLSLREAYAFACPAAFARLALQLGSAEVRDAFETFSLYQPPTLPGYDAPAPAQPTPLDFRDLELRRSAVGQGRLTISPLEMASIAAGILNDGNAPQPFILTATRPPGAAEWLVEQPVRPTSPIATLTTARQLQDLMRYAVRGGAAQPAAHDDADIGGHVALAYSGESAQTWFIGFAALGGRRGAAVAVVLENTADPALAADIGGAALAAAATRLAEPTPGT